MTRLSRSGHNLPRWCIEKAVEYASKHSRSGSFIYNVLRVTKDLTFGDFWQCLVTEIMKDKGNTRISNTLGWITAIAMMIAVMAWLWR
jgi:hypothetical protein